MRSTRRTHLGVLAVPVAFAVLSGACGDDTGGDDTGGRPKILATTSIWADVVGDLVCDGHAEVESLVPVGGDPHSFEPSLADRGELEDAALVVANGLGLEEGLEDTLNAVEDAGTPVVRLAEWVDPLAYSGIVDDDHRDDLDDDHGGGHDDGHDDDHDDGHDVLDPHIWFDPLRVIAMLGPLSERLVADTGLDEGVVARCRVLLEQDLRSLDAEIGDKVAQIPPERRKLVTNHDSLGYLAARYGFEVIGTVLPAPSGLAETNPAQLEALAELIAAEEVPAVFAEEQHDADDARALADRVGGIAVVTLSTGSLGAPGSASDSYVGLLRTATDLIVTALR